MRRRTFLHNSLFAFGAISLGKQKILQAMQIDAWKITMLTDDIGIFTEKGGTIAFHFSKEGITVIDAQFPDTAPHLIAELKKRKDEPFSLLINTHHHGDHTSGNIAFKGITDHVLAHKNSLANQQRVAVAHNTVDKQYYPNQTFNKEIKKDIGNEKVVLYYYGAGHTNGDAFVHFENANIVHVGDLVFNRRHPFVDRSAGANMKSWISVLDSALKKFDDKTVFVCGHSGENYDVKGSKEMLLSFRDYLGNVLNFVEKEIKAGKSKDDILKATEVPGSPEWKGEGIQRPLTAAYEEITEA
jgi:glyoxylase-like metal-dependent hydrolase (beta-lactamase superfamily II)